jgi:cytochrome b
MRHFVPGPTAWSRPVRLLHWLVAGCVVVNLSNDTGYAHRMIGYAVLGLVVLRLAHALWTRNMAERLRLPGFRDIRQHLSHLFHRRLDSTPGHNPLGQLAVYAMWLLIGLLALTGWISRTDAYWGEGWPIDLHARLSDAMLAMVMLHVAAVAGMSWWLRQNLIKPMIMRTQDRNALK